MNVGFQTPRGKYTKTTTTTKLKGKKKKKICGEWTKQWAKSKSRIKSY